MDISWLIGVALLVLGLTMFLVSRLIRNPTKSGYGDEVAARLTPVPAATQKTVARLLYEGQTAGAAKALRKAADLSVSQSEIAADLLSRGKTLPVTFEDAIRRLGEDYSDLDRRLRHIVREEGPGVAVRHLRQQVPLGLATSEKLIQAQQTAIGVKPA